MSAYKIVGRFKDKEQQKSWCRGKQGTQAKKRVYATESDYNRYSPLLIERWLRLYDVEVYRNDEEGWELIKTL